MKKDFDFVVKSVDIAKARKVVVELNTSEPLGTLDSIVKEAGQLSGKGRYREAINRLKSKGGEEHF